VGVDLRGAETLGFCTALVLEEFFALPNPPDRLAVAALLLERNCAVFT
jgi:hypothetical protein